MVWHGVVPLRCPTRQEKSISPTVAAVFTRTCLHAAPWKTAKPEDIVVAVAVKVSDEDLGSAQKLAVKLHVNFEAFEFQRSHVENLWTATIPLAHPAWKIFVGDLVDHGEILAQNAKVGNHMHVVSPGTLGSYVEKDHVMKKDHVQKPTNTIMEPVKKLLLPKGASNVQIMSAVHAVVEVALGASQIARVCAPKDTWMDVLDGASFPPLSNMRVGGLAFSFPVSVRYVEDVPPAESGTRYGLTVLGDGSEIEIDEHNKMWLNGLSLPQKQSKVFCLRSRSVCCKLCDHYNAVVEKTPRDELMDSVREHLRGLQSEHALKPSDFSHGNLSACGCRRLTHTVKVYMGEYEEEEIVLCAAHQEELELAARSAKIAGMLSAPLSSQLA